MVISLRINFISNIIHLYFLNNYTLIKKKINVKINLYTMERTKCGRVKFWSKMTIGAIRAKLFSIILG